ncbi:DUF1992 domain-containing protein [Aquihabitans sp. McL0605]|uniref:DnaJ family domain-containing protein n=1 Tax=Aquihabitans sp. McL0605 TaxID=3415671 RepID=UPI003CF40CAF
MAGRKPPQVTFETWVDRQIRDGAAKGAFDDLPRGPIELADQHDADWWIKRKIRDEGLEVLPPSLILRRDIERAVGDAREAPTEDEARLRIEAVNDRIRTANRVAVAGPPITLVAHPVDEFLDRWRTDHPADLTSAPSAEPAGSTPPRRRWRWRVIRRR